MQECALITTSGTIVSRIDPTTGLAMPVLSGEDLMASLKLRTAVQGTLQAV